MSRSRHRGKRRISRRARIYRAIIAWYLKRIDARTLDIARTRKRLDFFGGLGRMPRRVSARYETLAGLPAAWLVPHGAPDDSVLLYWHGGAYLVGSIRSHRPLVSHIANAAGVQAVIPEYRLAPEHRFPAAVDDAVRAYRQLLEDGNDASRIVVGGDSAGGGLTVAMLLSLRDADVPLPRACFLLSPWLDLTGSGESMRTRAGHDPLFKPHDMPHVVGQYCDEQELRLPLVSPVFADVHGLPPTLIQVGEDEILLSDSERYAEKLRAAGVEAELDVWPGMWHVWQMFVRLMPESRLANIKLGHFVRDRLAG
ncbi:MAG: alpha/beta hydrolase [Woeseiaceae bacterium]|nr:alpha/beta hydrolase [Woeseiaceae bacterium]